MNRLDKKCFIAAASTHGLLFLILFIGPAFFLSHERPDTTQQITIYSPDMLSDAPTHGGSPNVQTSAPPPPTQQKSEPAHVEPPQVKPPVEPPKIKTPPTKEKDLDPVDPKIKIKPVENSIEPAPRKRHQAVITDSDLKPTDTKPVKKPTKIKTPADDSQAQDEADRKERAARIGKIIKGIGGKLSAPTVVDVSPGVGGGGEASINYADLIQSKYYNAWTLSLDSADNSPTVSVHITVARSGKVVESHIVKRSGISALDKSVENVLETVTYIEAFPASFKESQRTYTIQFNPEAKR